jgi:ComF family protein
MHPLGKGLLDLLFPPRCQVCHQFDPAPLCDPCRDQIAPILPPLCERCGRPFDPLAITGPACGDCRDRRWSFVAARAYGRYEDGLRTAIHQFKYAGRRVLAHTLGEMLAVALAEAARDRTDVFAGSAGAGAIFPTHADVVCPVPLHPKRLKRRGFNQSALLARALGERTGFAVEEELLLRVRDTHPQVDLPADERRRNVRGAFAVADGLSLRKQTVVLVDDVFTTGATLQECSAALRRAGADRVFVLTVARAR